MEGFSFHQTGRCCWTGRGDGGSLVLLALKYVVVAGVGCCRVFVLLALGVQLDVKFDSKVFEAISAGYAVYRAPLILLLTLQV